MQMGSLEILKRLADYDRALWQQTWESIFALTEGQFTQSLPYSHGSVRDQMVHVAATVKRWLGGLKEVRDARSWRPDPADYPSPAQAMALWQGAAQDLEAFLSSLTEEDLERVPRGMRGPMWQVIAHLVNHGTDHRAQVLRALHDFGAPTFDQDLVFYLWRRDPPDAAGG
jgi:uncharacterized damage-inducible protein DinB